jgi:hypothetical protein
LFSGGGKRAASRGFLKQSWHSLSFVDFNSSLLPVNTMLFVRFSHNNAYALMQNKPPFLAVLLKKEKAGSLFTPGTGRLNQD